MIFFQILFLILEKMLNHNSFFKLSEENFGVLPGKILGITTYLEKNNAQKDFLAIYYSFLCEPVLYRHRHRGLKVISLIFQIMGYPQSIATVNKYISSLNSRYSAS